MGRVRRALVNHICSRAAAEASGAMVVPEVVAASIGDSG